MEKLKELLERLELNGGLDMEWMPIIITDNESGRKVYCTILEAAFIRSGFFSFETLWDIYKDDYTVQIMNGINPA
jgi:hypothetical protein